MANEIANWSKAEFKIYMLLLCAKFAHHEAEEEIALIKSKTDEATFNKIHNEFACDEENDCFEKIEDAINQLEYSPRELLQLKQEILEVFISDNEISQRERYLKKVFDNILY